MAPKKRAQAKALSEGVAKETQAQAANRRRQLKRRDTEMAVDRIMQKYGDWPTPNVDVKKVNGRTFREALVEAKRSAKTSNGKIGCRQLHLIAALYKPEQEASEALKPINPNEDLDGKLVKAIKQAGSASYQSEASLSGLVGWFATAGAPNQRTIVGLLRYMMQLNPANHVANTSCILQCMRWVKRNSLQTTFKSEIEHFKGWMESALCSHLANMKRQGVVVATWWDITKDICDLVLDCSLVEKIIKADEDYASVETELEDLTQRTTLGCKMYGFAMSQVVINRFSPFVEGELAKLGDSFPSDEYRQLSEAVDAKAQDLRVDELCPEPREITVQYRGYQLSLTARSAMHEFSLRSACTFKEKAVAAGVLEQLHFEKAIFGELSVKKQPKLEWHSEMLQKFAAARTVANEQITEANSSNGTMLNHTFRLRLPLMVQIDESFRIEHAFCLALSAGVGELKLRDQVLACLPGASCEMIVSQSRAALEALLKTPLFRFVSMEAQAAAKEVLAQVTNIEKGDRPEMKHWDQSEHLSQVRSCFQYFVTKKDGKSVLHGEAALIAILEEMQTKFGKGERVNVNDTKIFESFSFLLSPERLRQSTKLCSDILAACQNSASSSSDRPAKKAKKGDKAAASGKGTEKLDEFVLGFFS